MWNAPILLKYEVISKGMMYVSFVIETLHFMHVMPQIKHFKILAIYTII